VENPGTSFVEGSLQARMRGRAPPGQSNHAVAGDAFEGTILY
jgi:hypothetical protein